MIPAATTLRAFADLTPTEPRRALDVGGSGPVYWLPYNRSLLVQGAAASESPLLRDDVVLDRLAALDTLHRHERLLREGWVFLTGKAEIDGRSVEINLPLLSQPVRLRRHFGAFGAYSLEAAGDREILSLIDNKEVAAVLEDTADFGGGALATFGAYEQAALGRERPGFAQPYGDLEALLDRLPELQRWIREVAEAAGLSVSAVVPPQRSEQAQHQGLVAVVGAALYVARDPGQVGVRETLTVWSRLLAGIEESAFAALYREGVEAARPPGRPVLSPLPLSRTQNDVVLRSRTEPVTALAGAPGTGKSHTLVAIALDAVAAGQSVLVATKSDHAAEVLGEMLSRYPGPVPVLFGNAERRTAIAAQLSAGLDAPLSSGDLERAWRRAAETHERVAWLESLIAGART
ncbi:MAG: AAA family ATPase [Acidimicrobiia bacterium]|nr:AAA family ATPase [Acidimicrobiia bacterium]